ncbi:hypothetical protein PQE75_gp173 [Bacillus phage vB_BcoS-136]|uniref:Uncharacterized protein n=1 Tax=Bacillus phage vB_BcoS-136 TaxID=2419619 RepID=A0A3G3BW34_9CAUD|nr:hypothetical protein PQE75_gp173 [Bacillus phage vB_BcoS-136]AYP68306.1 hypothetical protein vBBcoS136_00192 [Bacillus phage vB_BcoS-136]
MGVYKHEYILIGAKVDTEVLNEEFFDSGDNDDLLRERKHKVGELAYLYDGYSGEYFIVGIPLQVKHDGHDGLDYFEFTTASTQYIDYVRKVSKHVEEKFNKYVEPKLIVLSHYT